LSIVDITFAIQHEGTSVTNWEVLDETSLSDHNYVHFCVEANAEVNSTPATFTKVVPSKLKEFLEHRPLPISLAIPHVDALTTRLSDAITNICGSLHRPHTGRARRSNYWWSPELRPFARTTTISDVFTIAKGKELATNPA